MGGVFRKTPVLPWAAASLVSRLDHGNMGTWETWEHGNMGTWEHGNRRNMGTWEHEEHGNMGNMRDMTSIPSANSHFTIFYNFPLFWGICFSIVGRMFPILGYIFPILGYSFSFGPSSAVLGRFGPVGARSGTCCCSVLFFCVLVRL